MKLPITILAVLIFLMGGPLGLMQYHSRAAFIELPAHSLSSSPSDRPISCIAVGEILSNSLAARLTALDGRLGSARDLATFYETHRAKWFTCSHSSGQLTGLMQATRRAIVESWARWQPTFVALPERLAELGDGGLHKVCRSRYEALADHLKPVPIPGLLAAMANAIGKSGTKWQPAVVVFPRWLNGLRKRYFLASLQRLFEDHTVASIEAAALARTLPHGESDHPDTNESDITFRIIETESIHMVFSRTPLPAVATIALGAITSDLAVVRAVPVGRVVAGLIRGLRSPTLRISNLVEPARWRPALVRGIGHISQAGADNR